MMPIIQKGDLQVKRYSQMSRVELQGAIRELESQLSHAAFESELEIIKQKIAVARSYLIDPATIEIGGRYRVADTAKLFQVAYLNGIFAWGTLEGEEKEQAFPIALLQRQK
jgi:hypothetical protein